MSAPKPMDMFPEEVVRNNDGSYYPPAGVVKHLLHTFSIQPQQEA